MSQPIHSTPLRIHNATPFPTPDGKKTWSVIVYYLSPPDKVNEKLYGMGSLIGTFNSRELAEEWCTKLAQREDKFMPHFRIKETGDWFVISPKVDNLEIVDNQKMVEREAQSDKEGQKFYLNQQMRDMEERQKQIEEAQERRKRDQEMEMELLDENSLLYYGKLQMQKRYQENFVAKSETQVQLGKEALGKMTRLLEKMDKTHPDFAEKWQKEVEKKMK